MGFRTARLNSQKTVAEVMEHMDVSDASVYMWETGITTPRPDKLLKLSEFYGCTVEDLLRDNPTKSAVH